MIDALIMRNKTNKVTVAKIIGRMIHNSMSRRRRSKIKQTDSLNPLLITKNVTVQLGHHKITNQLIEGMNLSRWRRRLDKANGELLVSALRCNGRRVEGTWQPSWSSVDDLKPWRNKVEGIQGEFLPWLALVEVGRLDDAREEVKMQWDSSTPAREVSL